MSLNALQFRWTTSKELLASKIYFATDIWVYRTIIDSVLEGISDGEINHILQDAKAFNRIKTACQVAARLQKV